MEATSVYWGSVGVREIIAGTSCLEFGVNRA